MMTNQNNKVAGRRGARMAMLLAATVAGAALTGCSNAGEGAFSGAAVGALTGLAIGSIFGEAGTGAAVGALGGAAVGGVMGDQNQRADNRAQGYYGNAGYSRSYTHDGYPRDW